MNMQPKAITTKIQLTDSQRSELSKTLGIDIKYIPDELGILGVGRDSVSRLGLPNTATTHFSPALIMM
ncbi:hypothetical protein HUX88_23510 [Duganella sp. BJB1802]|uniref:hypothetical protein n=1 Tax=Duganella sp. BJB1802 TaxID=2744575 RepID=UPI00159474BF|nr:hypothetical protein [Duganella sp. BJB1802]NVD73483.1 hypothetical protein [Duganella sp. BJB1802]